MESGPYSFVVAVENSEPVVAGIADFSMGAGSGPVSKTADARDPEGKALTMALDSGYPSYISVSGLSLTFTPPQTQPSATIPLSYTLSDGINTLPFTFTLTLTNLPPVWLEPLFDQTCTVGTICHYSPSYADPEGAAVTLTYAPDVPPWVTDGFRIAPGYDVGPGAYEVRDVVLSDGAGGQSAAGAFWIKVVNNPPSEFTLVDVAINVGEVYNYSIPSSSDPEGNPLSLSISNLDPSYMTLTPPTLRLSPPPSEPHSTRLITLTYSDGALTTARTFTLTILNAPPYLPLVDQQLMPNVESQYSLPMAVDPEGSAVTVEYSNAGEMPGYIRWSEGNRTMSFFPSEADAGSRFSARFAISDGSHMVEQELNITVGMVPRGNGGVAQNSGPPYFVTTPSISLHAGTKLVYELPDIADPDSDTIDPPFITLGPILPFSKLIGATMIELAPEIRDIGKYKFKVLLRDQNPSQVRSIEYLIPVEILPIDAPLNEKAPTKVQSNQTFAPNWVSLQFAKGIINNDGLLSLRFVPQLQNEKLIHSMQYSPFKVTLVEPSWIGNTPTKSMVQKVLKSEPMATVELGYNVTEVTKMQITLQLNLSIIASLPYSQVSYSICLMICSNITLYMYS
ncbi:hypothetical protein FGO68_gene13800 [Halteria grandinella]|uniref:Dystroglycan-type cadherin-like domain-containing protein n=1 Tax=Halteria grandinella TaxID=5974 RepID=A0A8J8SXV6_HALGN|nr:hypothetical protein FGO68_gene13800 [Halteria grandinella]